MTKLSSSSIWIRFLLLLLLLTFSHFFLLPLGMPIESEIMDRLWHSRCLNDRIDLLYMIGTFASGANASLEAKNGTKTIIPLLWIISSQILMFEVSKQLYRSPHMIRSFASGATNSLVAKIGTKDLATSCSVFRFWTNGQILMFKVSKQPYQSPPHDKITCKWRNFLPGGKKIIKKLSQLFEELLGSNSEHEQNLSFEPNM